MELIGTDTAPISRWWVKEGINLVDRYPDLFSRSKMRQARTYLIAGSNRLDTIKGWLLASKILYSEGRGYFVSDFGKILKQNDPEFEMASTWWAFHLSICFSERNEPYFTLFSVLNPIENIWIAWDEVSSRCKKQLNNFSETTVEYELAGVKEIFRENRPLTDLGLIEFRTHAQKLYARLGSPTIPDEILLHALALARFHHFRSHITVNFKELLNIGFNHFLCLTPEELRKHLRKLSRSVRWQSMLSFHETKGLDSLQFSEDLNWRKTLLILLQETEDTWL